MHCLLCKPRSLLKANTFMGMVKQKSRLYHSELLQVFLACGIHAKLQSAEGGIPALSLTSQVPCHRLAQLGCELSCSLFPDELYHRDGADAYSQAIQGLEIPKLLEDTRV